MPLTTSKWAQIGLYGVVCFHLAPFTGMAETVRLKAIIGRFQVRRWRAGKKKAWTVKPRLVGSV